MAGVTAVVCQPFLSVHEKQPDCGTQSNRKYVATDMTTGMILALLKHVIEYRNDSKVVVMSATINLEKFTQYFNTQNIQYIKEATADYLTCAYRVVEMIVKNNPKGDILLFLTTTREIEVACAMIRRMVPGLRVLTLYSALQSEA
ncbi:hypothetical protein CEP53_003916 [Fusarium sp. AF-6]|nr:hypothetical protein CEP53_003916 [Fusarium sp. AF-6]